MPNGAAKPSFSCNGGNGVGKHYMTGRGRRDIAPQSFPDAEDGPDGFKFFYPPPCQLIVVSRLSRWIIRPLKPIHKRHLLLLLLVQWITPPEKIARCPRLLLPDVPLNTRPRQNLHTHRLPSVPYRTRKHSTRETTSPFLRRSAHRR